MREWRRKVGALTGRRRGFTCGALVAIFAAINIFITGGTLGLGAELAKLYLADGHRVAVCGRNREHFEKTFREENANLVYYAADVSRLEDVQRTLWDFSKNQPPDIVIANAGVVSTTVNHRTDFDKNRKVLEVNLWGVYNTIEVAVCIMERQRTGTIVAISSLAGRIAVPGNPGYTASKIAITSLCETLSLDLSHSGIRLMTVEPGYIDTRMSEGAGHGMPFLVAASSAARKIKNGIERGKSHMAFPFPLVAAIAMAQLLPNFILRRLLTSRLLNLEFKPSLTEDTALQLEPTRPEGAIGEGPRNDRAV